MSPPSSRPSRDRDEKQSSIQTTLKKRWNDVIDSISPRDHPAQIAARTYALSASLSLLPALLPVLTRKSDVNVSRLAAVKRIFARELGPQGFASAMTLAVGGGAALDRVARETEVFEAYGRRKITFGANILSSLLAIALYMGPVGLRTTRSKKPIVPIKPAVVPLTPPPSTASSALIDLTLLLAVRAGDALLQTLLSLRSRKKADGEHQERKHQVMPRVDVAVFWLSCARIMWCFFYEPHRLPHSYVRWISSLAAMDQRLIIALRGLREGTWNYTGNLTSENRALLASLASDLGYPSKWGDPKLLPHKGGSNATKAWRQLGVLGRDGVGGLPCEVVHCGASGASCFANAANRGIVAFLKALAIYTPVHVLPVLLTRPLALLTSPLPTILALVRSSAFLSTFVSSIWLTVCFVRTLAFARFFPHISHDILDGPQGCILAGCMVCGASIGIERGKRRGEIALYVLPRAIRTLLPDRWLKEGGRRLITTQGAVFVLALSSLLTTARHDPSSLRGLSKWTLAFILQGPGSGFLGRRVKTV